MGITPLVFTGISQFSDDFQTILDRTVAIASVPIQQMQMEQGDLLTKKQLLTDLRGVVESLATSVGDLGAIGQNRALSASSSNTSRVTVTLNGATDPGTYTITDITSVAATASETSASGYATQDATEVSADGTLELAFGGETYEIDLTGEYANTLEGLRDAINSLGAGVSASILNTGTGENPYYLSITAANTGATTLELRETPGEPASNILTSDNQGANAEFTLNGLPVVQSSNTINDVVPGLSFTINQTTEPGESVILSLASSRTELGNALSGLVSAYNTVRTQVAGQIGESAGLLSGDYIIREVQNSLRGIASFRGEGTVASLMDLGIEFTDQGEMTFDSTQFYALPESTFNAALDFMDSSNDGFGSLAGSLTQISDPVTGLIRTQQDQYDVADARLTDQITTLSERIDYMQQSTSLKLQQADVLLAQLESQQVMIEASLQSLELVLYGKQED